MWVVPIQSDGLNRKRLIFLKEEILPADHLWSQAAILFWVCNLPAVRIQTHTISLSFFLSILILFLWTILANTSPMKNYALENKGKPEIDQAVQRLNPSLKLVQFQIRIR